MTGQLEIDAALDALPQRYRGPGGVAGVVRDGQIVATRAWGHADPGAHRPMTRETRLPICSISKQFTCGVLLAAVGEPERLEGRLATLLPQFRDRLPSPRQLCHNQSGLRDYWALTVLQGARAEQTFAQGDALPLIARMKTGHFAPGTSYSYCNVNFRLLAEMIEAETGRPLADLYEEHIWRPAGMRTAALTPDTRRPVDGVIGFEGREATGFVPADNGIWWAGDAGISASLADMLAYECWIDATREDEESLYRRLSVPPTFADGTPAPYGFGLKHEVISGVRVTGHGGALRGFRSSRMNAREERVSVVVMFNHDADAHGAAEFLLRAVLGLETPAAAPVPEGFDGQWMCEATRLSVRLETGRDSATLRYATAPETLVFRDGALRSQTGVEFALTDGSATLLRPGEALSSTLVPLPAAGTPDAAEIAGRYRSDELDADMVIETRDGATHAFFDGMLGTGPMERVHPLGPDVWLLATRRSMDAPAPGDWTLRITRDATGQVTGATLGCWLARNVGYRRVG